jgi:hypothetical protein
MLCHSESLLFKNAPSIDETIRVRFIKVLLLVFAVSTDVCLTPSAIAIETSTSIYCLRKHLATIIENPHRAKKLVRPIKTHIIKNGTSYYNASLTEQIAYLTHHVKGLEWDQAEYILRSVFEHPASTQKTRVVFGGSRVRGNSTPTSDLDVGIYDFGNNRVDKLIKKVNRQVSYGNFKIRLEETKIYEGNKTKEIPEILSPEEFFMRKGKASMPDGKIRKFKSSGFISLGADGTIVHVPAMQKHNPTN